MSLDRCHQCDRIMVTDDFPEGYYDEEGNAGDDYLCNNCNQEEE